MSAIITAILALLGDAAPLLNSASGIAKAITLLEQAIPLAVQIGQDLVQPIKNIIAALSVNAATEADQLAQLQALDAKVDADFEAAATAAEAEDSKSQS